MKKQLLLAAAVFVSTLAMAQTKPSIGIRAGLSEAGIKGAAMSNLQDIIDFSNGMITTGNHSGFFAGPYVTLPLSEKVSIEPALYYSQKGTSLKGDIAVKAVSLLGVHAGAKLNAQYIDLPVLVKANFNGFQVFAGPQVSYLAQAGLKTTAGVLGINLLHKNINITDQFNRWDAGVTGGIGYQFANGVNITAAYDHSLSRLDANKSVNAYNRSFKIGLGVTF
jgi:Outer membrane protein beta-barrel domain